MDSNQTEAKRVDDGGPAFPSLSQMTRGVDRDGNSYHDATGPLGMTLRDWFAGQALAGILADPETSGKFDDFANSAYSHADAMLAARKGGVA